MTEEQVLQVRAALISSNQASQKLGSIYAALIQNAPLVSTSSEAVMYQAFLDTIYQIQREVDTSTLHLLQVLDV
jgi:hypothetical protein